MLRTPQGQFTQDSTALSAQSMHDSVAAGDALDGVATEARQLSAALRTRLRWLEKGGVHGVPKPQRSFRPSKEISAAAHPVDVNAQAAEPAIIEHVLPPAPPPPSRKPQQPALSAPAYARTATLVEAVYPELPAPAELRGQEGMGAVRRVLGDCRRCKLCHGRNNIVFGDGTPDAWLAFVGEGPGADEDRLGKPFVGAAGQLLDRMIDAMAVEARKRGLHETAEHLSRSAVYICNVVKCRPPGNRTPETDEIASCAPFLRSQLYSLRPTLRAIVALGRTPTQYLLKTSTAISSLRGNFADWEGIRVMPTYHPAYLLRTPSAKRQVWEDLQKVLEILSEPLPPK